MMKSQSPFQAAFQPTTTSGEATMQVETEVMRAHQMAAGPLDFTPSIAGLSLTFDAGMNALTRDQAPWNPVQSQTGCSLTDLSSIGADPFSRTTLAPAAAAAFPPAQVRIFNGGAGSDIAVSRGKGLFCSRDSQRGPPVVSTMLPSFYPQHYNMTPSCTTPPGEVPGSGRLSHSAAPSSGGLNISATASCGSFGISAASLSGSLNISGTCTWPNPRLKRPTPPTPSPNTGLPDGVRLPQRRGATQLWEFLLEMLNQEGNEAIICWIDRATREFRVLDPDELAMRWGTLKGRPRMNYDKLSRSLRYYYQKKLLSKVPTEKYVYRFLCPPTALYDALGGRDKRRNKKSAVNEDDQSLEATPSPANNSATPTPGEPDVERDASTVQQLGCFGEPTVQQLGCFGESTVQQLSCFPCGNPPISPQSDGDQSAGVTALIQERIRSRSQLKEVCSNITWRPPSPKSPDRTQYSSDSNKQPGRYRPYNLPRQNSCPNNFPRQVAPPPIYTSLPGFYMTQQSNSAEFDPGSTLSLPANFDLGYFSWDYDQNNFDIETYNPGSPGSSAPGSPHSVLSDNSVGSDKSETSIGLMEFVKEFIEKDVDLPLFLDDSYNQLLPFPPVASVAAQMPPFST